MRTIVLLISTTILLFSWGGAALARRAQAEATPGVARPLAVAEQARTSRPPSDLPLDHWSYAILERLTARGAVDLDLSTRPVARSAVASAVARALRESGDGGTVGLSDRERWLLDRLAAEFLRGRVDRPALTHRDGDASVGFGVLMGTRVSYSDGVEETPESGDGEYEAADDEFATEVTVDYELWGGLRGLVGFYAETGIVLGGQEGERNVRISSRTREWRGVTATVERAYFKFEREHFSLAAGRRAPAWGRSRWGRLLLSGNAEPFDQIDASFNVGPLTFHALHAWLEYEETGSELDLSDDESVFLAGHRMVVSGSRGSVGVSECVAYSAVTPDPVYLNPLAPYYLLQHNERENDNVIWSLDWTLRPAHGWDFYGEFLVDDLQYERTTGSPDKYAVTVGQAWYGDVAGTDMELTAEYSQARKWTYTHKHVEHRFAHDGEPIGFDLGPDADRLTLEVATSPVRDWTARFRYSHTREGEGTLEEPFEPDDNADGAFPSGNVVASDAVSFEVRFDDLDERRAGLGISFERTDDSDDVWSAWAAFGFRI